MKPIRLQVIIASLAILLTQTITTVANAQQPRIGLRNLANNKVGFWNRFGTSVTYNQLINSDGVYPGVVAGEFSMIEPENELKPATIWRDNPDSSQWDWYGADTVVNWARDRNINVRGHTLVYAGDGGYRIPDWLVVKKNQLNREQARQLLETYVRTVVRRYKGKIIAWDVVNECVTGDNNTGRWFDMVDDFWYQKLGRDYVLLACQYAYAEDPNVELNINDYGVETPGNKIDNLVELVTWLRSNKNFDGTPIKVGIGMQYHLKVDNTINPDSENDPYVQVARRLQNSGIPFTITEMDVWMPVTDGYNNGGKGLNPQYSNDLNRQANLYRNALKLAQKFWICQGFQIWGVTDKGSWLPQFLWENQGQIGGAGLLFNQYYEPKPAYNALQEELGRNIPNGTYSLGSRLATGQVLDVYNSSTIGMWGWNTGPNQKWNVTWQGNGTYRLSPLTNLNTALDTWNALGNPGPLQLYSAWGGPNQEWVITPTSNNFYRISPRQAVWRGLGTNSNNANNNTLVGIWDYTNANSQQWQFQAR